MLQYPLPVIIALILIPLALGALLAWLLAMRFVLFPITARLLRNLEKGLPTLTFIIHTSSFGYLTIQPPRFRDENSFSHSNLCENCQQAIQTSALLRGSGSLLARTDERILLFDGLEDMQRSWKGCHFCEALLSNLTRANDDSDSEPQQMRGYGTMATAMRFGRYESFVTPGKGRVYLHLRYRKGSARHSQGLLTAFLDDKSGRAQSTAVLISIGRLRETEPNDPSFTGSPSTFTTIKHWIRSCSEGSKGHEACRPLDSYSNPETFLPSRLLFIGSLEAPQLRIVDTKLEFSPNTGGRLTEYIALSHCWGGEIPCRLTTTNQSALRDSIPQTTLPPNFSDAVQASRHLGIQYLWIDSLCILQDSPADWAAESPTMGLVFAQAICVLSATASADSSGGCFRHRTAPRYERELMRSEIQGEMQQCSISFGPPSVRTLFDTRVETAPLTKRAWAFQERLLSRRQVHFCADAVLFECNSVQASEFDPDGIAYEREPYAIRGGRLVGWFETKIINPLVRMGRRGGQDEESARARRGIRGALDALHALGKAVELPTVAEKIEFSNRWFDIVSAYSEGELTRQTDKLVAISGVAALVQAQAQAWYLAGLWYVYEVLELQLLWVILGEPGGEVMPYCAPSWSWASVNGRIGLLPRDELQTTRLSRESVIIIARVNRAVVFCNNRAVDKADSLVDAGYLVVIGPVTGVSLGRDGPRVLRMRGGPLGNRGPSLRFFPDRAGLGEEVHANGSGDLIALHVLRVRHSADKQLHYGLVLRMKSRTIRNAGRQEWRRMRFSSRNWPDDEEVVCERVGVWMTAEDIMDTPPVVTGGSVFTGGPRWSRKKIMIV